MRKVIDNVRLMVKVCDLYYNQNISQQQIAARMGLSRPTVSRMLSLAREQGIVRITISNLEEIRYWEMERQLEKLYNLREVLIVDTCDSDEEQKEVLGKAAGRYIEGMIKDGNKVGISMGSTLREVVRHVEKPEARDVTFVPLVGGMGRLRTELHANSLAEELARIYDGHFVPLHAPARVSSPRIRDELIREESLSAAIGLADKLNIALVGIGYPNENSAITATGYFKDNEIESLKERNVAGDICMQFFDLQGNTTPFTEDNNVIGADIHKLKNVPVSVGIAGGMSKLSSLIGAINGNYINILITDVKSASALIARAS